MAAAKPKIDLKARLGRKSTAPAAVPEGAQAAAPAAAMPSAAPGASVAPLGGSLPAPAKAAAPVVQPAAGFGGPSVPPPPGFGPKPTQPKPSMAAPAQQAIKLEMGEEVIAARKQGRSKFLVAMLFVGLACSGAGFIIGQLAKGAEGAQAAVDGAELLIKEIDESNVALEKLNETLKAAAGKVRKNEFPSKELEALGALEIPFSGQNLTGKGIGRFNATAATMLMQYANAAQDAADRKDRVRSLFGFAKKSFEEAKASKDNPKVMYGVSVTQGPKGPWAKVQGVTPFEVNKKDDKKYRWPNELEIGKGKKTKRYLKGDPLKADGQELVPIDPAGVAAMCPNTVQSRLLKALMDLGSDLTGKQDEMGTVALGDKAMDQLRRIGGSR